jgi:Fur family ferric uptake transcriptional regulator
MRGSEKLTKVGLKVTGPRLKVLQIFEAQEHLHLTADDIRRRMLEQDVRISLATLYRVLAHLTELGILHRCIFDGDRAMYELDHGIHDHLICLGCGRVDEFADETIEKRKRITAQASGYALTTHRHTLFGYCSACRASYQPGAAARRPRS